ncbi:TIGR03364 family FAD-dependent oxidoreductase [Microbacterium sp. W1N]|uniref:TIGR03364 family FAD-dependent oxidoreductase n=1 Tax=Microbacterium festucae TaxID=2977531 RepID=UPI0021BF2253|nr:TIGR03364 family FAD-dependent oxidoreductase [Microbacterium festucae]MCT9820935.1 TIGR03364 family FAD-dependent oxidoreductase [Microbacterium festucae]
MSAAHGPVDVLVIGGGIVGLGAAYAAHRRGLSVAVVERQQRATGASIRNFGHLCVTPQTGQALAYGTVARELWRQLAAEAGLWLRETGTVVAARHPDELALIAALRRERETAGRPGEVVELGADEVRRLTGITAPELQGGALLPRDLQADPREAVPAVTAHLQAQGVRFHLRTAVTGIRSADGGVRVETTRGPLSAGTVVVAVGHDIDQLLPELAESADVQRCTLDMLRVAMPAAVRLEAPVLTGWSLIRYGAFASLPEAAPVRARLHGDRPDLAAIDLNQMYTQRPDGTLLVGDTHARDISPSPFQTEVAADLMLAETQALFGAAPRVIERWQGVYASGRGDYLVAEPQPGVHVAVVTTGIGMTTGLGLAEATISRVFGPAPALSHEGTS